MTRPNDWIAPSEYEVKDYHGNVSMRLGGGLTKLEYFAAMAMQGFIIHFGAKYDKNNNWHAEESVKAAKALINELNKQQ